jgi:predicted MFS family arabinose efflux permease
MLLWLGPVLGTLVGALAWARIIDRLGPRRVFAVTLVQGIAVALVLPWVVAIPQLWYACVIAVTAALGPAVAAGHVLVANHGPRTALAETFGYVVLAESIATGLASILGDALLRAKGSAATATSAVPVLCLLLALVLWHALRDPAGRVPRAPATTTPAGAEPW